MPASLSLGHYLLLLILLFVIIGLIRYVRVRWGPEIKRPAARDPGPAARLLRWPVLAMAALLVLYAIGLIIEYRWIMALPPDLPVEAMPLPDGGLFDKAMLAVGGALLTAMLASGALFLFWTWRMARNNHAFAGDPGALSVSPAGAVIWYFIPVAALWVPFGAVREGWQVAHDPFGWRAQKVPIILRVWWGLCIAIGITEWFSIWREDTLFFIRDVLLVSQIDIALTLAKLPFLWLTLKVVDMITTAQQARLPPSTMAEEASALAG